jgi:predicted DNA-binding WGR domain protein
MRLGDLEKRAPAQNQLRFYQIAIAPTLFGEWAVVREWGRIGQPGTVRERWFATEAAARDAGRRLRAQKERRGYRARAG